MKLYNLLDAGNWSGDESYYEGIETKHYFYALIVAVLALIALTH